MKKKNYIKVYLAAICYSLVTGFSFVFTKFALEFSDPIHILAHRFLFSLITLVIILVVTKRLSFFNLPNFKKILPLALVYPLLFFGFQTFGLQYASSSEGGILLAIAPVFTLLLSRIILKEKASLVQILSVILSVSGVIFIVYNKSKQSVEGSGGNLLGIILLIITTISFALYSVLGRWYTSKYSNLQMLTVMITVGFIAFNLLAISGDVSKGEIALFFAPFLNVKYLVAILYLGILSTLGTALLTNYILKQLEPAKMSVFANLSTLVSIVAGALVLNEAVYSYHIVGAACIVVGVLGTNLGKEKGKPVNKS